MKVKLERLAWVVPATSMTADRLRFARNLQKQYADVLILKRESNRGIILFTLDTEMQTRLNNLMKNQREFNPREIFVEVLDGKIHAISKRPSHSDAA